MLRICLISILVSFLLVVAVQSQEYVIGPDDVLSITFWQQPDLNTTAKVNKEGKIVLPIIGSITAAGLTPTKLADKIVDRISLYNRNITQATVVVTEYGSKKIYITGQVLSPGKYTFEAIPNLWEVILEAGGPTESASLSNVVIIRKGGQTFTVDLNEALRKGDLSSLPKLRPGDMVYIPSAAVPSPGAEAPGQPAAPGVSAPAGGALQALENSIYIYGQVARPGVYPFTKGLDLIRALIIAGGPTIDAKLDEIQVTTREAKYPVMAKVDLTKYSRGEPLSPFMLHPGDTIFVPRRPPSPWTGIWSRAVGEVIRVLAAVGVSLVIYNVVR